MQKKTQNEVMEAKQGCVREMPLRQFFWEIKCVILIDFLNERSTIKTEYFFNFGWSKSRLLFKDIVPP